MTLLSIQSTARSLQFKVSEYRKHQGTDKATEMALREQIAVSIPAEYLDRT
jgi:hypothetical protein